MKRKQLLLLGIFALNLCVGCGNLSLLPAAQSSASDAANCAYGISAACHDDNAPEPALASVQENQKLFAPYAPYGMTYDSAKNQLFYNGKLVRWFEDRYPIEGEDGDEGLYAGADFFCEEGIVDVYATRDLTHLPQNPDGSQDPSGILTGLQEFSQEEFDARNIEAIKNPPITEAIDSEGGELTQEEIQNMAEEYRPYGLTYDSKTAQWRYDGQKVNCCLDILTSNGASPTGGNFQGTLRSFGDKDNKGGVNIRTIRDFAHPNPEGNGTLTGIEACAPEK